MTRFVDIPVNNGVKVGQVIVVGNTAWRPEALKTDKKLVSWCFKPSQAQCIRSGLKTNFNLSPSYSVHKSSYHRSQFLKPQLKFCPQFRNAKPEKQQYVFWSLYLYSANTQHGNLHPAGWPILFCGPTQEAVLATANTGKTRERFWKKCG